MPITYRPTSLKARERHCPRAMERQMAGDRGPGTDMFQTGIAAHHVLQAIGEATNEHRAALEIHTMERIARGVCEKLISEGREFDGKPEPPLTPDRAWAGRDVALDWIASHPPEPGASYECGLAVDQEWNPVLYDSPDARLRCIVDVLRRDEWSDEESSVVSVTVRDYKSAWSTSDAELRTAQLKTQAVLARIHYPEAETLTVEVVNLRTWGTYSETLYLSAEGGAVLDEWRGDLESTMDGLDELPATDNEPRLNAWPAIPGGGCSGCPYLGDCDEARELLNAYGLDDPTEAAHRLAVLKAETKRLTAWLKKSTDQEPIRLDSGHIVGTLAVDQKAAKDDAPSTAWDEWEISGGDPAGFARAVGLGSGNLTKLAKALYPEKAMAKDRDVFLSEVLTTKIARRFDIHKRPEGEEEE